MYVYVYPLIYHEHDMTQAPARKKSTVVDPDPSFKKKISISIENYNNLAFANNSYSKILHDNIDACNFCRLDPDFVVLEG